MVEWEKNFQEARMKREVKIGKLKIGGETPLSFNL